MKLYANILRLARYGAFAATLLVGATSFAATPAFPGAEGFGMYTTGGRGGKVYHVTKLTDGTEEGTLRYAVNQKGARTIVFDVGGIIELESQLTISNGDITIAGQTAPGDGICIKNHTVYVGANNVVIRFLRFRLGTDKPDGYNDDGTPYQDRDAIWGRNQSDIILDHCSMSWCTDECASFYNNKNFTMQWCILAESLRGSIHPKGNHGFGGIWGGQGASFHHNMLVHHDSRNPRFCGSRYTNEPDKELVDYRNNVLYNWGSTNSGYAAEGGNYNFVNNYFKSGPATKKSIRYRIFNPNADDGSNAQPKGVYGYFYVNGNYMAGKGENWDWNGIDVSNGNNSEMTKETIKKTTEFAVTSVTTHKATVAYEKVLKLAGASLKRDAVDTRVTKEAKDSTYTYTGSKLGGLGIIDAVSDVGGYPTYNSATKPTDTDGDGMPDEWETAKGLNPKDASDGAATASDGSGYTNLELYMNSLVCEIMSDGLADALTASTYTCDNSSTETAVAKITKYGGGSSNQTKTKGSTLDGFYYGWENATTVKLEGDIPDGVEYVIDNNKKTITFSGTLSDKVGKYSAILKTVGGANEATYNLSFTITEPTYVVNKQKFDFIVGVDGDFKAAKAAAEASKNDRFYIFFPNGSYNIGPLTGDSNQKTTYSRAKTSFIGQSMDGVLIYNTSSSEGISITATLYLDSKANLIYMQDLTLQNKANIVTGAQANRWVVLQDRGDKNIFKRVKLLSTQDTYYSTAYDYRTYWEEGEIHGTVDFICGGGDVFFNNCLIYLEERKGNVISAPANSSDYGYVFSNCTIDGHEINKGSYRLGRPWNNKASSVFINTTMKVLPTAEAWGDPMNVVPTKFAEYNSVDANGNAVDLSKRRKYFSFTDKSSVFHETTINPVLTASEAANYTIKNVVGGTDNWTPDNDCKLVSAPKVKVSDRTISWPDNDSALCYFIFKNDVYVANITENSYEIPWDATADDKFTVRAANQMGGLGESSKAISADGTVDNSSSFIFYYGNGDVSSTRNDEVTDKWTCTDAGKTDYAWAITGRTNKNVLYGNTITYNNAEYSTFKNSNGAQNTFYLPKGYVAKKVRFIGYSNNETNIGYLTELNGVSLNLPMSTNTGTTNYAKSPSVITQSFAEPACGQFTFTFGTAQVCFIIALEVEEADCSTTEVNEAFANPLPSGPVYDLFGRVIDPSHLQAGKVYIQDGKRFIIVHK